MLNSLGHFLSSGLFSPSSMVTGPIESLLNAADRKERDKLTEKWRDHKLAELNFVGIVVQAALLTGCLTSTGSWPNILPNSRTPPWQVRTCWYVGIIFGLASILCAADQTIRLHRLSSYRNGLPHIRHLLRSAKKDVDGTVRARRFQAYTWQLPVILLTLSALTMMMGMWVLIWTSAVLSRDGDARWTGDVKGAVCFTVLSATTFIVFFGGQITLFSPLIELEDEESI